VGIGYSCQCPLGRKLGGSRVSLNTVAKIIIIGLLIK
jgi:hypothetical protein